MREPKFVPGERVVITETVRTPHLVGATTVIIDAIWNDSYGVFIYKSEANAELGTFHREDHLKKLPPETPATFDASIWVPNKESVK